MLFVVRDFAPAEDATHEVGIRLAAALFDTLGILRIELERVVRDGLVIVAVTLSRASSTTSPHVI